MKKLIGVSYHNAFNTKIKTITTAGEGSRSIPGGSNFRTGRRVYSAYLFIQTPQGLYRNWGKKDKSESAITM
jgi:hypothetical protein